MHRCLVILFSCAALNISAQPADSALPASGPLVSQFSQVETVMRDVMAKHGVRAGTVAIMKDSKLVLREGFGWADANRTIVIHPDNLFRITAIRSWRVPPVVSG